MNFLQYIWDNHKFLLIFTLVITSLIYNRYPIFKQITFILKYCFIVILILPELIWTIINYFKKMKYLYRNHYNGKNNKINRVSIKKCN